ncbi:MAG: FHA domain-containing protein [Mesorhizobium sp.]|uniref:SctD/MshK family protein n=1 Tax=unclassified Mesorhizobium TaxID=325217 RepID=UPI000FCAAFA2|nr:MULTISPECIES: EscD/YscD/HrpQ family type III secretion system periplasmic domain-containing protein [unclassified Mesorhizobium]RVD70079.1 FHA domain-containing protein [Mesorhizobium sp. M4A.F.Ca.ET.029.04.2.1]RUX51941.1 FHA domain-containing protein [Mesorhizobium sp. M4A.F.Ca.ET.050.02.1.1]RVD42719.1 FHA domain-containing protein [Mesorhizobium sp. M4A.F.Ca.ET.020.02.1.1]RWC20218.1 MAG: FHA domain-containing protein [Mesorhizobium sp.]RWD04658.1 MAG: FHA domain-containing protein [Mesorh
MTDTPIGRYLDAAPARRLRSIIARSPASGHSVVLSVTHGFHTGAELSLVEPQYTIGSSTESDIVLRDAGIAPVHARLRRKGGQFEIEAVGGDVALATGETIHEGHGSRCRLPLTIGVGDARIRLVNPERPASRWSFSNRPLLVAGSVLCAVFALSLAANGLSLAKPDIGEMQPAQDGEPVRMAFAGETGKEVLDDSSPAQLQTAAEAESRLKQRLEQSGISTLTVQRSPGRLVVSGMIPNDKSGVWTETQSWFDQAFGAHIPLVSNVMIGDAQQAPRLTLQAIWYGDRPYVIAADGARYHEGAFTNDGWTIKHIGETELLLTKGGATVALKYP